MAHDETMDADRRRKPWYARIPVFHVGVTAASLLLAGCCAVAALSFVAGCPECIRRQALREGVMSVPGVTLEVKRGAVLLLRGADGAVGGSCLASSGARATTMVSDAGWGPSARVTDAGGGVVARAPVATPPRPACGVGVEGYLRDYDDWAVVPEPALRR